VRSYENKGENYLFNYSELQHLLKLIPSDVLVKEGEYKELFRQLRKDIDHLRRVKRKLSDESEEVRHFIETLSRNFQEIASVVAPILRMGAG
jgi:hypothetical protein